MKFADLLAANNALTGAVILNWNLCRIPAESVAWKIGRWNLGAME
jgi:hypothetical protein